MNSCENKAMTKEEAIQILKDHKLGIELHLENELYDLSNAYTMQENPKVDDYKIEKLIGIAAIAVAKELTNESEVAKVEVKYDNGEIDEFTTEALTDRKRIEVLENNTTIIQDVLINYGEILKSQKNTFKIIQQTLSNLKEITGKFLKDRGEL